MTDTRLVLITTSVFVRAPVDAEALDEMLDLVSDRLGEAIKQVVSADPLLEAPEVYSFHYPGDEGENTAQCSRCGRWTTDMDLPQTIDGLPWGYKSEGIFRCDECHYHSRKEAEAEKQ